MKIHLRLYVTSRDDPVPDLDEVKTADQLHKWKKEVKRHAILQKEYTDISNSLIIDLSGYEIHECYSLIAYSKGQMTEASQNVGNKLLELLKENQQNLNWVLDETGESAKTLDEIARAHPMLDPKKLWDNFTYSLLMDKELSEDEFEADLEVIIKK